MIFSLRRSWRLLRVVVLFLVLVYLLYCVFVRLFAWLTPIQQYKIPTGNAVKVTGSSIVEEQVEDSFLERLRFFYWYGE